MSVDWSASLDAAQTPLDNGLVFATAKRSLLTAFIFNPWGHLDPEGGEPRTTRKEQGI